MMSVVEKCLTTGTNQIVDIRLSRSLSLAALIPGDRSFNEDERHAAGKAGST